MALSEESLASRLNVNKPFFFCTSRKHRGTRYPILYDDMFRCGIPGCYCFKMNGWIATCRGCGALIHNCPWGCEEGICMNALKWDSPADFMENGNEDRPGHHIEAHGYCHHTGKPVNLEY